MVKSIRLLYRNIQNRVRCNYNWDWQKMCERSAVMVTAVEWSGGCGTGAVTYTHDCYQRREQMCSTSSSCPEPSC